LPGTFSFSPGIGTGHIAGNFNINTDNLNYHFYFIMQKLDLNIIGQYLKDMTSYGTFTAYLDAKIDAKGSFKEGENSDIKGRVAINDFHFGKNRNEDYFSFDTLVLAINELNPKKNLYQLDSLILTHPYFKYEKYDYLDNMETMFGEQGTNVAAVSTYNQRFNLILEIGHYIVDLSRNFFESEYKINNAAIKRADIKFNDYSTNEKFSIDANPLYIISDSINKSHGEVKIFLNSGIQPYGNMTVYASINPRDSANFDLNYHFNKIPITLFNAYLISSTSFPLNRGTIEFNGAWKVRNGYIQSENHLLIIDPRVTKRLKNKADRWIPMWLVFYFVRERSNVVDYQIPITGNLKDPKFHLHEVVFSTLRNIFVKPVVTPYILKVKSAEEDVEKSLAINWRMHQTSLTSLQEKFMQKIADFLAKKPDASIAVSPELYPLKEKEYILFFEAKKKYYLAEHPEKVKTFSESDSEHVDKMSVKDSSFVHYLNKHLKHSLVFTIQDKCSDLIDSNVVKTKYYLLNKSRINTFISYFREKGVENRVTFTPSQNIIPYNGFSYYRIEYKGELPEYLVKAYREIDELNNKTPREKYEKERKKIKTP
jgi:hypothetical protein